MSETRQTRKVGDRVTRLLHPVPEAMAALGGMSRSTIYELFAKGEIKTVKVGRRTYVPADELRRYVDSLTAGEVVA